MYRRAATEAGHDPATLKVSINSPGFVAATHQEAISVSHPYFQAGWMANHHQRGQGVPMPKMAYEAQATAAGAFFLGSTQEVVDKILAQYELFRHDRMMIRLGFGNVPQKEALKSIELLGSEVAPVVRKEIASLSGKEVTA
ncbi:LLM class flavin-dependent oxidoreductase [Streptomyces sp. NBC_01589]|uniref:LLM class flavin-dependent oxidoreductase n=1 Tax=Streptomyces sp. NBC_01589 TaxID=2975886 RepID=UPI0038704DA1